MKSEKEQKKNENINKVKSSIKLIAISTLILVIFVTILLTIFSTRFSSNNLAFLNYRFYVMESELHPDIAEKGDLVIAKIAQPGEIVKGDNIVYKDGNVYYCDNVEETMQSNIIYRWIIAEDEGIRYKFDETEIEGKIIYNIKNLGSIILFLRTPLGIILFIIFTICIFIILRVLLLRRKENNKKMYRQEDITNNNIENLKENNNCNDVNRQKHKNDSNNTKLNEQKNNYSNTKK